MKTVEQIRALSKSGARASQPRGSQRRLRGQTTQTTLLCAATARARV